MSSKHTANVVKIVEHQCAEHGSVQGRSYRVAGAWTTPRCPECNAIETAQRDAKEKHREAENSAAQRVKMKARFLEQSNIPFKYQNAGFANFEAATPTMQKVKDVTLRYAKDFPDYAAKGTCLIMCGNTGTGKTHLACAMARNIISMHARSVYFSEVIRVIRSVKETYNHNSEITEQQAIDRFTRFDLLILDEIGLQLGSDAEKRIVLEIINNRYSSSKPTILLSNLNMADLGQYIGDDRAMDRLKEGGGSLLRFEGESYRTKGNTSC